MCASYDFFPEEPLKICRFLLQVIVAKDCHNSNIFIASFFFCLGIDPIVFLGCHIIDCGMGRSTNICRWKICCQQKQNYTLNVSSANNIYETISFEPLSFNYIRHPLSQKPAIWNFHYVKLFIWFLQHSHWLPL